MKVYLEGASIMSSSIKRGNSWVRTNRRKGTIAPPASKRAGVECFGNARSQVTKVVTIPEIVLGPLSLLVFFILSLLQQSTLLYLSKDIAGCDNNIGTVVCFAISSRTRDERWAGQAWSPE